MRHINQTVEQLGGELRHETLNGESYLVAPVVAIQEGVYMYPRANGRGIKREFLNSEELEDSEPEWEGVPLTIPHPEDDKGRPGLITNRETTHTAVGLFRNVGVKDGSLVGETWIEEAAVGTVNGDLAEYVDGIESGRPQEVSTGYRANTDTERGEYDNQQYAYVQNRLEPDHLALLPDERGNCSVAEGCGAGATVNQMPFAGEDGARLNNRRLTVDDVAAGGDEGEELVAHANTLSDISEPSGALSVDEGRSGSDTGGGTIRELLTRLNNLLAGEQPAGDLEATDAVDDTENMQENKIDRENLIDEIVTNSDMKEKSVKELGDSCLQVAHEKFVNSEADAEGGDDTTDVETTESPDEPETTESPGESERVAELEARFEEQQAIIEDLKSEREAEKANLEEQVNRRLIENTELAEETVVNMDLSDKQNMADDLGATEDEPDEQTVNMNGIPDSGAATDFEIDDEEVDGADIAPPGRTNYDAFNEGDN